MRRHRLSGLVATSILLAAPGLRAGSDEGIGAGHDLALTFSPFALLYPIAEVAGEYQVLESLGAGLILGVGKNEFDSDEKLMFWEAGAQVVYYPVGGFDHGMQVGVEAMFESVSANANRMRHYGYAAGPLIGYKLVLSFGMTLAVQSGFAWVKSHRRDTKSDAGVEKSNVQLLMNVNLGWSFAL